MDQHRMDRWDGENTPKQVGQGGGRGERTLDSRALFADAQVLVIVHGQERYRLQRTRSGKLILTK